MKFLVFLLLVLSLLTIPVAFAQNALKLPKNAGLQNLPAYVPGEVLIKYRPNVSSQARKAHMKCLGVTSSGTIGRTDIERVKLPAGVSVEEAAARYRQDPNVEQVEPNIIYRIVRQPADPLFPQLWGLYNVGQTVNGATGTPGADIGAFNAWDIQTGSNSVIVAVIDTGVDYHHPDLSANILRDPSGNLVGYDFVDNDTDPMDYNMHGSHVAGTIGAMGNNSLGVTGINWNVKIMPIRAFDTTGESNTAFLIAAIDYARDHGAHIINASWGSPQVSDLLKSHIDSFGAAGGLFVAAVGNYGSNNDQRPFYPASFPLANIITVAATDQNDGMASFSNYGTGSVHVAAPGTNINSTVPPREYKLGPNTFNTDFPGDWARGEAPALPPGQHVWGVTFVQPGDGRLTANYLVGEDSYVRPPQFDLTGWVGCETSFYLGYTIKQGDTFGLEASTNGGATWNTLNSYSGSTGNYLYYTEENLKAYEGLASVSLRFRLRTLANSPGGGFVSLDNFQVTCASNKYDGSLMTYGYFTGTSMSTAHTTGVAALVKAENPALTNTEIKQILMETVDPRSLPVASGGRINAYKAVSSASLGIPTDLIARGTAGGVELSWTDNSNNETGFVIQRSGVSGGPYTDVGTADTDATTYVDTSVSASSTYYYRVRSKNSVADSLPSNEASATTPAGSPGGGGGGSDCFIATAAFGSPLAKEVLVLRQFRDRYLLTNASGRRLVSLYYRFSPPAARFIREHEAMRTLTRLLLLPVVYTVKYPVAMLLLVSVLLIAGLVSCGRNWRGPEDKRLRGDDIRRIRS